MNNDDETSLRGLVNSNWLIVNNFMGILRVIFHNHISIIKTEPVRKIHDG